MSFIIITTFINFNIYLPRFMKTGFANIIYFLSLFTVLFACVVLGGGCFVVRDLCRSGCRGNSANSRS